MGQEMGGELVKRGWETGNRRETFTHSSFDIHTHHIPYTAHTSDAPLDTEIENEQSTR